jgi:dTMP kinase
MTGKFITLEGIEGSGKSTSLSDITKILDKYSISYITTKEPGGGPLGTELRSLLLNKNSNITSEVELLLMMADRKDHVDNLILPNLENGVWVLSDRYLDSTYAYQGGGRQIETSTIDKLANILNLPKPDLTILYDLPPDVALQRAAQRSAFDRFESEPVDFHTRIRNAYLERAKREKERFKIVNSSTDFDGVKEQVLKIITKFLDE